MRTVGSPGRRSETKENLFSFCEQGGTEGCYLPKSLPDDEARQKKIYFHFASKEERKDFAKQKPHTLASAKFIK